MTFTFASSIWHDSTKNEIMNHIMQNIPGSEFKITEEPDSRIKNVGKFEYESSEGIDYHIYKLGGR